MTKEELLSRLNGEEWNDFEVKEEQRRSSVAGLTEYPTDSVHEEWQVGDTVQLRTEPFEL